MSSSAGGATLRNVFLGSKFVLRNIARKLYTPPVSLLSLLSAVAAVVVGSFCKETAGLRAMGGLLVGEGGLSGLGIFLEQ